MVFCCTVADGVWFVVFSEFVNKIKRIEFIVFIHTEIVFFLFSFPLVTKLSGSNQMCRPHSDHTWLHKHCTQYQRWKIPIYSQFVSSDRSFVQWSVPHQFNQKTDWQNQLFDDADDGQRQKNILNFKFLFSVWVFFLFLRAKTIINNNNNTK